MSIVDVYFSPRGGVAVNLGQLISRAEKNVYVMAYEFTSTYLAEALVQAKQRGVMVTVILDRRASETHSSMRHYLVNSGVPVLLDGMHPIAHNKVMLIDGHYLVTGSYNFTDAAEQHNAENCIVMDDPMLYDRYDANFVQHLHHSEPAA